MTSREWSRRGSDPRARDRLSALAEPAPRSPSLDGTFEAHAAVTDGTQPVEARADGARPDDDGTRAVPPQAGAAATEAHGPADPADDLLARLRSGALTTAATAYTAANGHPLEHPDLLEAPARRWRLSVRSALVVALVLVAIAGVVVLRGWTSSSAAVVPFEEAPSVTDPFASEPGRVVVHVVGEVETPGVVELPPGARVSEAVEAAGGATDDAALGAVNLARVVADGEQILVPSLAGAEDGQGTGEGTEGVAGDSRLDLNAADAAAFETLPGIGPVLAERIVAWRTDHGRFSSVDELAEVSGIGPSLLGKLSDLVRVG